MTEHERSQHKVRWFILAGYDLAAEAKRCPELGCATMARLFSTVTSHEMSLSDREFLSLWTDEGAARRKQIRIDEGHLVVDEELGELRTAEKKKQLPRIKRLNCHKCNELFESRRRNAKYCPKCKGLNDALGVRLCESGPRCFGADRRGTPAPAAPGKQYCTDTCRDCDKVRRKRGHGGKTLPEEPASLAHF